MVRMVFYMLLCTLAFLLSGCSPAGRESERKLAEANEKIAELDAALARMKAAAEQDRQALDEARDKHMAALHNVKTSMRREINEHSRTIGRLRRELAEAQVALPPTEDVAAIPSTSPRPDEPEPTEPDYQVPPITVFRPPPADTSMFAVEFDDPAANPFPVLILDVEGKTIVTGTHTSIRTVTTGEMVRNSFREMVPVRREEAVTREEFDTVVTFRAINRTRLAQTIACRAGREIKTWSLPPEGEITGELPSLRGASLRVKAGARTRSFPVAYITRPK